MVYIMDMISDSLVFMICSVKESMKESGEERGEERGE